MQDKALGMLGLAQKAGKIASGEFATEKAVKERNAYLVIVADDASDNTKKNFTDMCKFYKCDILFHWDKETMGNALGKQFRASVAVCDENMALAIKKKLSGITE
jgi:ribosomal protein L7Ae-like RNA K-turn-binding protein